MVSCSSLGLETGYTQCEYLCGVHVPSGKYLEDTSKQTTVSSTLLHPEHSFNHPSVHGYITKAAQIM
jgi:hypothetical protein